MKLEELMIFPFIKDNLDQYPVFSYHAGELISQACMEDKGIFFIVSGQVRVVSVSKIGKQILVDALGENNFLGKISDFYNAYFACDIIAETDCRLILIRKANYRELMKNREFYILFLEKTSQRIYHMYKWMLAKSFFGLSELIAYYICSHIAEDGIFTFKSTTQLCEELDISRRGFYNVFNKFLKQGYLEKKKGYYRITDRSALELEAAGVWNYLEETNSERK